MSDKFSAYANPEKLVSTDWLSEHLNDADLRIVESNEDLLLYDMGHIPGAVHIDWRRDLNDQLQRDYVDPAGFAEVCARNGIGPDTTVVFYGDKSNWWACYALWVFNLFGHTKTKILDGGRDKWKAEGREMTKEIPSHPAAQYPVPESRDDQTDRAFYADALKHMAARLPMVDVRSPGEFLSLIHISEPTRQDTRSRFPSCG